MSHIIMNNLVNFTTKITQAKVELNINEVTFGEKIIDGLWYTLIGMGITFLVLVIIAFIIGAFKYISVLETYMSNKKAAKSAKLSKIPVAVAPVIKEIKPVEVVLTDDLELVAVIAAAIAASLNTTTDNLQVRSIRKIRA